MIIDISSVEISFRVIAKKSAKLCSIKVRVKATQWPFFFDIVQKLGGVFAF